jgi:hypothetical protein
LKEEEGMFAVAVVGVVNTAQQHCQVAAVAQPLAVKGWAIGDPVVESGQVERPLGIYRNSDTSILLTNNDKRAPVLKILRDGKLPSQVAARALICCIFGAGQTHSFVVSGSNLFTDPNGIVENSDVGEVYVTNGKGPVPVVKITQNGVAKELIKKGRSLVTSLTALTVNRKTGMVYIVNKFEPIPFYHPGNT